jgi:hypothetical protein
MLLLLLLLLLLGMPGCLALGTGVRCCASLPCGGGMKANRKAGITQLKPHIYGAAAHGSAGDVQQ